MCKPILIYGMDYIPINNVCKQKLENILEQSLGFSKRSGTSHLLHALNVDTI